MGAQAVSHLPVDVKDLNADFYVFSGHKLYGPTGIGVLYVNQNMLPCRLVFLVRGAIKEVLGQNCFG